MHVVEFLQVFFLAEDSKGIKAALPGAMRRRAMNGPGQGESFQHLGTPGMSGVLTKVRQGELCGTLLEALHNLGGIGPLGGPDQQVEMFRHQHPSEEAEVLLPAKLAEGLDEVTAAAVRIKQAGATATYEKIIDAAGNNPTEYVFFGARRTARRDSLGNVNYYLSDQLGSSRVVTNADGSAVLDDCDFLPYGDEQCVASTSGNDYKFAGKERDTESGLDYFGARYYGSTMGRMMSPDPFIPFNLKKDKFQAWISNPQTWNLYAYVRNNPTTLTDPTGLYTANCNDDVKNCSKQIANFDKTLQQGFKSKNEDIRKAAQAYGTLGEKNGVNVTFANVVDPKHSDVLGTVTAQAGTGGATYDENTKTFQQATQVTMKAGLGGSQLEETALHEGVHVEDRAAIVNSINGSFDRSLNITGRQSEINAYGLENIFRRSVGLPMLDIQDILAHPPYSDNPNIDRPLFPDLPGPQ